MPEGSKITNAVGETVLGVELSFTWWVIFFELFVLLAALAHLIGKPFSTCTLLLTILLQILPSLCALLTTLLIMLCFSYLYSVSLSRLLLHSCTLFLFCWRSKLTRQDKLTGLNHDVEDVLFLIGAGAGFMPIGSSAIAGILAVVTALSMLETQSKVLPGLQH